MLSGPNCDDWTKSTAFARVGALGATSANWTSYATPTCNQSLRLYCFEK
jgi:hypothetical protein